MDISNLIGAITVGAIMGVVGVIGAKRKPSQALQDKPKDMLLFSTTASRMEVFQIAQRYAGQANMKVEEINETEARIVLGQNMQGFHNGFWLPIYVRESPGGPTLVEVGIKSKTAQMSFALTKIRNKAVKELKAMLPVV